MAETHDLTTPRMSIYREAPEYYKGMLGFAGTTLGIESSLDELIKIRVSQINGRGFCLDMHTKEAMAAGESVQRIVLLDAWRESPQFTERERAALALAESVTLVSADHVPDDVYDAAAEVFESHELAEIIWRIAIINTWNRIAITTWMVPGSYRLRATAAASAAGG